MTSKSDFKMLMTLKSKLTLKQRGIISDSEVKTIHETLELSQRSDIELQNIRDMTVMFYGSDLDKVGKNVSAGMTIMDAMSAITTVIDSEKHRRGLEV